MTGDTWPGEPGEQSNTAVLALMTGVALGVVVTGDRVDHVSRLGAGGLRAGTSGDSTILTGVTWPGVTCWVEMQGVDATPGAGFGPGSTLPDPMLLPLPVLSEVWLCKRSRWGE